MGTRAVASHSSQEHNLWLSRPQHSNRNLQQSPANTRSYHRGPPGGFNVAMYKEFLQVQQRPCKRKSVSI